MFCNCKYYQMIDENDKKYDGKHKLNYEDLQYGVGEIRLCVPDWCIVADIDDKESGILAMKILDDQKIRYYACATNNGYHLYFKNKIDKNGNRLYKKNNSAEDKKNTCIGLRKIDLQSGASYQQVSLVHESKVREWVDNHKIPESHELLEKDLDEIPTWLIPNTHYKDFIIRVDVGARNNTLYKAKMQMLTNGFNLGETHKFCKLINNFIFKEPLSDSEFETTLRQAQPQDNLITKRDNVKLKNKDIAQSCANLEYNGIPRLQVRGELKNKVLYAYNGKYYSDDTSELDKHILNIDPNATEKTINDIKYRLMNEGYEYIEPTILENACVFNNGIVVMNDDSTIEILPHNPLYFVSRYINKDYVDEEEYKKNEEKYKEYKKNEEKYKECDEYLNDICGSNSQAQLEACLQYIGYIILSTNAKYRKFLVCKGPARTGKSTFWDFVRRSIGEANCSEVTITNLDSDNHPFQFSPSRNKMLNIDEECPKDELTNSTLRSLKNICSETSKIQYEEKNKRPISEHCTTKLVFITNHNFKISSTADVAVLERILVITFEKVQKAYSDVITKNIASKEWQERLIYRSINAAKKLWKNNGKFILDKYMENNYLKFICSTTATKEWLHKFRLDYQAKNVSEAEKVAYINDVEKTVNINKAKKVEPTGETAWIEYDMDHNVRFKIKKEEFITQYDEYYALLNALDDTTKSKP